MFQSSKGPPDFVGDPAAHRTAEQQDFRLWKLLAGLEKLIPTLGGPDREAIPLGQKMEALLWAGPLEKLYCERLRGS